MRNERLRALLLERGQTPDKLAEVVQVDAKTVERWIATGRIPYRRHRFELATFLGVDESYIWPDALGRNEVAVVSESEVVAVYPFGLVDVLSTVASVTCWPGGMRFGSACARQRPRTPGGEGQSFLAAFLSGFTLCLRLPGCWLAAAGTVARSPAPGPGCAPVQDAVEMGLVMDYADQGCLPPSRLPGPCPRTRTQRVRSAALAR